MVTCACENGISLYAGRDRTVKFTLTTSNPSPATPYDLTGAKVWLSVKDETSDTDANALILKRNDLAGGDATEINVIDPSGGILEVYFVPADTNSLEEGDYWFDLVIENSSAKVMQAVPPSKFHVSYTVTKVDS
jgi:hypothetical protein